MLKETIKDYRLKNGYSMMTFSQKAKVAFGTVYKIENTDENDTKKHLYDDVLARILVNGLEMSDEEMGKFLVAYIKEQADKANSKQ